MAVVAVASDISGEDMLVKTHMNSAHFVDFNTVLAVCCCISLYLFNTLVL